MEARYNFSNADVTQYMPYSTYSYLPILLVLGSLTHTVGYVPWIVLGVLGRNANTLITMFAPVEPKERAVGLIELAEVMCEFCSFG